MSDLLAEVVEHHVNLARWLGSEAGPDVLDAFRAAHRPEFTLVTIDGVKLGQEPLMTALEGSRNAAPGLEIGIEEFEVLVETAEVAVCRFLEVHSVGTLRRTTAVLTADPTARYGVGWLSVQETPVL
ncbi:hypothetical protein GCM10009789_78280 [Kribbella sancticallisti]|uniref:DUF4440 domain-containing protein n=1 Tax=Kribbella sancticallisti TaxID=460087 RepID=A0ABP4QJI2_9ACTN